MKQRIFLFIFTVTVFSLLSAAAGISSPQRFETDNEITPEPLVFINYIKSYPTEIEIEITPGYGSEDCNNYEIYYIHTKDYYGDGTDEELTFQLYDGYIDCYNCADISTINYNLGDHMIIAYAVADGMLPSNKVYHEYEITVWDYCDLLCNDEAFEIDGIYYRKNILDTTTVNVTYKEIITLGAAWLPPEIITDNLTYQNLEEAVIPSEVTHQGRTYKVTGIDSKTFNECHNLKSVTLPPTMKQIQDYAFLSEPHLEEVHISDLEAWCRVNLSYWSDLFADWSSGDVKLYLNEQELTHLVIPDGIDSLGTAFTGYEHLNSIVIPSSMEHFSDHYFLFYCSTITCKATTPPTLNDNYINQNANLYVPRAALEAYKAHEVWGRIEHIYAIEDVGDVDGDRVISVKDCTALIDQLLGGNNEGFNAAYADLNGEGLFDIKDVTALIDKLLNSN